MPWADRLWNASGGGIGPDGHPEPPGREILMIRHILAVTVVLLASAVCRGEEPKPAIPEWLVGTWSPAEKGKASADRFPCEFHRDGTLSVGEGDTKLSGNYRVIRLDDTCVVLKITLVRGDKPLPPEEATICYFRSHDQLVWYPEGEWKGVVLRRKK
jgi:hypothetical protein